MGDNYEEDDDYYDEDESDEEDDYEDQDENVEEETYENDEEDEDSAGEDVEEEEDSDSVILGPDGLPARRAWSHYSENTSERIERINGEIQSAAGTDFAVDIHQTQLFYAAFNGETVLITTGLAESLNDDELAGVLAHEHAHGYFEHLERARGRLLLLSTVISETWRNPDSGFFRKIVYSLFYGTGGYLAHKEVSRQEELEADVMAAEICARAGYDPAGIVSALGKMHAPEETDFFEGIVSSHPPLKERRYAILSK